LVLPDRLDPLARLVELAPRDREDFRVLRETRETRAIEATRGLLVQLDRRLV
jgi:hypothetical protein